MKEHKSIFWIDGTVLYLNYLGVIGLYALVKIHRIYSKKGEFYFMYIVPLIFKMKKKITYLEIPTKVCLLALTL